LIFLAPIRRTDGKGFKHFEQYYLCKRVTHQRKFIFWGRATVANVHSDHSYFSCYLCTTPLSGKSVVNADKWLFNQEALQEYILMCCQLASGGLIDKPGK